MTYEEVLSRARKVLAGTCNVCPVCDGVACRGRIPGVGAKDSGRSFTACVEFLRSVKVNLDTLYASHGQDPSCRLFGHTFSYPIFAAPIGGTLLNYHSDMTESEYTQALVSGTLRAGTAACTADGPKPQLFLDTLPIIQAAGGRAIPTIKPWDNQKLFEMTAQIQQTGAMAFAIDVDSAGHKNHALLGKPLYPKPVEELREVAQSTSVPLILKGIMTARGACKARQAGAQAIVVSSHGGRVLDDTPATCSLLPEIRRAVGPDFTIFVDGGIRSGLDVFKALALGADAVFIGRPYAISVFGGGAEGVELYTQKLGQELKDAMMMTGCATLADINPECIRLPHP